MSQDDTKALVRAGESALATTTPDDFEHAAHRLHDAIEQDKRSIERHLAELQVELERGMEQVAETRDKALDFKEDVDEKLQEVKSKLERLKDWKGIVRDYPWQTVGVSMALGFYLGSMLRE